MRTFIGDRCIQLLGLEAIEALAAKSEGARANFEQVRSSPLAFCCMICLFISVLSLASSSPRTRKYPLIQFFSSLPPFLPSSTQQEAAEELFGRIFELYPNDKDLQAAACQVGRAGGREGGREGMTEGKFKYSLLLRRNHSSLTTLPSFLPSFLPSLFQALVGLATGHPDWQTRLGCAGLCYRVAEILRRWPEDYGTQLSGTPSFPSSLPSSLPPFRFSPIVVRLESSSFPSSLPPSLSPFQVSTHSTLSFPGMRPMLNECSTRGLARCWCT